MFRRIGTPAGLVAAAGVTTRTLTVPVAGRSAAAGVATAAINPTGTRCLASRAGNFVYVAGMSGIDPRSDVLVVGEEARVRQAFLTMTLIAELEGATLKDAVHLVVYVTDMFRFRPIVNKVQAELWGGAPYPPRTIVEVYRLNQDDIVEVEGTFWVGQRRQR